MLETAEPLDMSRQAVLDWYSTRVLAGGSLERGTAWDVGIKHSEAAHFAAF